MISLVGKARSTFFTLLAILALLASAMPTDAQTISVERNPARIDLGVSSPTEAQVLPYRNLLGRLEPRCEEERTMIADMATRAMQLIERDYHRKVTVRHVLENLLAATEGERDAACSERFAALIVLIGKRGE